MEFPSAMETIPSFPGNQFLQGKEKTTLGTKSTLGTNLKSFVETYTFTLTFTLGTNQKPFVDTYTFTLETDQKPFTHRYKKTSQKPFTNSWKKHNIDLPFKDTHKKGGITAILSITAMIAVAIIATLKTVNMITTQILMSVESQGSFSDKLD